MLTDDEAGELAELQRRQFSDPSAQLSDAERARMSMLQDARRSDMSVPDAAHGGAAGDPSLRDGAVAETESDRIGTPPSRRRGVLWLAAAAAASVAIVVGSFLAGHALRPDGLVPADVSDAAARLAAEHDWDAGSAVFVGSMYGRDVFAGTKSNGATHCALAMHDGRDGRPVCAASGLPLALEDVGVRSEGDATYGIVVGRSSTGDPVLIAAVTDPDEGARRDASPDMSDPSMEASFRRAQAVIRKQDGVDSVALELAYASDTVVAWAYDRRCVILDVLDGVPASSLRAVEQAGLRTRVGCADRSTQISLVLGANELTPDVLAVLPAEISLRFSTPVIEVIVRER